MQTHYGRYEVRRLLGEGAASKVYVAFDPKLGREVALKILGADADPGLRQRFRREAQVIASLRHPNIVALLDYSGDEDDALYLVMEYVPSQSLYALGREHGLISEATALCVGHEITLALQHAHAEGVVHRDIKPENILLHDGRVVLTDFGGVKVVDNTDAAADSNTDVLGTPGFMAPEQFAGHGIGPATDFFALGATLYNVSTGRIPYDGGTVQGTYRNLKTGRYRDPRAHRQLLSPEFARLLATCLAPQPSERVASATALRQSIDNLLQWHGVADVRQELVSYQQSPATYTIAQRERAVDNLVAQLRTALGDNDIDHAHALVERIRALAPTDERLASVTGGGSRLAATRNPRLAWRRGVGVGLACGLALGALFALVVRWLIAA